MMKKIALLFLLTVVPSLVYAGGYRVALQGQKAQGLAHANVAMGNTAETIFFNPAGLTYIDDKEIIFGINAVSAQSRYQNISLSESASTDSPTSTPLNLYWGMPLSEHSAFGVGLYTPYGSKVVWPTDWAGSHLVNNIELATVLIQPTYAIELNDTTSLGIGGIIAIGEILLNRNLSTTLVDSDGDRSNVTLSDSGITEYGLNLGAMFTLNEKTKLGVNYRTEITMKSKGDANFEDIPVALSTVFVDGGYTSELPLPAELTIGFSYKKNDRLTFVADYNYTFWDAYESLVIRFDSVTDPTRAVSDNPRNYRNSGTYRFGVEYQKSKRLTIRGGIYYDETPIQDGYFAPETPRGDQTGLTAGLSYTSRENIDIDLSLLLLDFEQVDSSYDFNSAGPFEGSYATSTWSIGVGTSIKF